MSCRSILFVFTVFSGLIPITVLIAARFGVPEAADLRNHVEGVGFLIVALGVCFLCAITLLGQSGFVRGGWSVALAGLALTCISAVSLTVMMFQSRRLDRLGVAPVAHYGLRFPLYVVVALFAAGLGVDAKGPVDPRGLALVVLVGFVIIAFPVFTMQKAMSLISTLTLAAITALGPLFVFLFQLVEGKRPMRAALDDQILLVRLPVPWRQVVESVDLVIGQPVQEIGDIDLGIEVAELCGLDDGHDGGCIFGAAVGACKGPIAPSDDQGPDRALSGVVIDGDGWIVEAEGGTTVAFRAEGVPSRQAVVDRAGEIEFFRQFLESGLEPGLEVFGQAAALGVAHGLALCFGFAADRPLDVIELADPIERLLGDR
jgi:hypothetical protein